MIVWDRDKGVKLLMGLQDDIQLQPMYQGVRTYTTMVVTTYRVKQLNTGQLNMATSS